MGLFDALANSVLGEFAMGVVIFVSILPVLGLAMATEQLVALGLPRTVVGSVAAVLMVVWAVALLGYLAKQVDWE